MPAYPALVIVARGDASLPPVAEVESVVLAAFEDAWGSPADMVRGVRRDTVAFQDETPPAPPVETEGVVVSFGQLPVTMYDEAVSPFRLATRAIYEAFNEGGSPTDWQVEMQLAAVPQ